MKTTSNFLTVLVNTSDNFEDCWRPFFELLSRHWANCNVPILLNTETKIWAYPGLDIRCAQVQVRARPARRLSWSECLLEALSQVETPLVLYMQEDYFIERPVDTRLITELAELMNSNVQIKHIGLTHFGSNGPFLPTKDVRLWEISRKSRYRISTQAGLWRVDTLKSYLRPDENGWMFEIFGTRRARRRNDHLLTLNREMFSPSRRLAIQYIHTGIIKGKWHPDIPPVFEHFGIAMDYSKRGFYKPGSWVRRKIETGFRVLAHPAAALRAIFG